MAQLLRIAPQVPQIDTRVPRVGPNFLQQAGRGLTELGAEFQTIQDTADAAERTNLKVKAEESMKSALQDAELKHVNADAFAENAPQAVRDAMQAYVDSASNEKVRATLKMDLEPRLMAHQRAIDLQTQKKRIDKAAADSIETRSLLREQAINEPDETNRKGIVAMYADSLGETVAHGLLDEAPAKADIIKFKREVDSEHMALIAARTPHDFIDRVERGEFKGVESVAVERALNIAARTAEQIAVRDKRQMAQDSDTVERELERLAENKQLDPRVVDKAAQVFGWDKNKKDGLLNIQIGVKVASPFEQKLINDAMEPARRNVRYEMADVVEAERKLKQGVKERSISSSTPEYRAAIDHLQGMAKALRIESDIKTREAEFDARGAVNNLYGKYFPGRRNENIQSEVNDHLLKLRKMDAGEQGSYVKELERKLEKDASTLAPSGSIQADKLRGALKDKR